MLNISVGGVEFLGESGLGYGPRYWQLEAVAQTALFFAWISWGWALLRSWHACEGSTANFEREDIRRIGIYLFRLALALIAGVMEYLRRSL